jgi:hypothetical protein
MREGYGQNDEKTNIYVDMHIDGFRGFNPICRGQRPKSGIDSAHFDATTTQSTEMGGSLALNRSHQTRGSAAVPV